MSVAASTAVTAAATATAAAMVAGARLTGAASPMPTTDVAAVMASPQWMKAGSDGEAEELNEIDMHSVEPEGKSGVPQMGNQNSGNMHAGKNAVEGDTSTQNFPCLRGEDMQTNVDAAKNKMKEVLQTLGLTHTEQEAIHVNDSQADSRASVERADDIGSGQ